MNCKLCGKSLYEQITFGSLFAKVKEIHQSCFQKLPFSMEEVLLPFQNKYIQYHSIVDYLPEGFSSSYIAEKYGGRCYESALSNSDWSIVLDTNLEVFSELPDIALVLLFALSEQNILLITVDKKLLYYLENIL